MTQGTLTDPSIYVGRTWLPDMQIWAIPLIALGIAVLGLLTAALVSRRRQCPRNRTHRPQRWSTPPPRAKGTGPTCQSTATPLDPPERPSA